LLLYVLGKIFDTIPSEWYICSDIPNFEVSCINIRRSVSSSALPTTRMESFDTVAWFGEPFKA